MLFHILVERHGLLNDFLVQLRSIEQVQTVLAPHGKTEVGDVESFLVACDGDDITVLNGLTHQFRVFNSRLGDIAIALTRQSLFLLANSRHLFRVFLQRTL